MAPRLKAPTSTEVQASVSPWLMPLANWLGRRLLMPAYFKHIQMTGQEHLPRSGATILAPTHRARWDALLIPYAAGQSVTGRDLHYMVSADEMTGLQGWFIGRLGGFPVNTQKPSIATLRTGIQLLRQQKMLVIFPEGGIFRGADQVQPIQPGIARLALQAESDHEGLNTRIVPISIRYDTTLPHWWGTVSLSIGEPLVVADYCRKPLKDCAGRLQTDLQSALQTLHQNNVLSA